MQKIIPFLLISTIIFCSETEKVIIKLNAVQNILPQKFEENLLNRSCELYIEPTKPQKNSSEKKKPKRPTISTTVINATKIAPEEIVINIYDGFIKDFNKIIISYQKKYEDKERIYVYVKNCTIKDLHKAYQGGPAIQLLEITECTITNCKNNLLYNVLWANISNNILGKHAYSTLSKVVPNSYITLKDNLQKDIVDTKENSSVNN